jgi:aminomethyltransferase
MLLQPLHHKHKDEYHAKFVDFWGWQAVEQYTSVEDELNLIKEKAGLCDESFVPVFVVVGRDAFKLLQKLAVADLKKISPGRLIYTSFLDESAKMIDDNTILWVDDDYFIINSSFPRENTIAWINKRAAGLCAHVTEMPFAVFSMQGPKSREIAHKAVDVSGLPYAGVKRVKIGRVPVILARFGYSGELGYEFYCAPQYAYELWDAMMELGKDYGLRPYGVATANAISLEKGFLMDVDFYEGGTHLEYGLGWTVGWNKDFIGKKALLKRKKEGLKTRLMGFEVLDPAVTATKGDKLFKDGKTVGEVTHGAHGFRVKKNLGRGSVNIEYAKAGEELAMEHGGSRVKVRLAPSYRWYDPENKILRS